MRRAVDGAAAAVLLGSGEEDGWDGREVGGPVVVTAGIGVHPDRVEGGGGAPVLRRERGASGRRLLRPRRQNKVSNRRVQAGVAHGRRNPSVN